MSQSRKPLTMVTSGGVAVDDNVVKLVGTNHILFYSAVSTTTISTLHTIILELVHGPKPPPLIHLHLFSDGGCAYAGMCAYDIIRKCPIPIHTIVEGRVCSAATYMSTAGHRRVMMENASFMVHQISTEFSGSIDDLKIDLKNIKSITAQCMSMYMSATGLSMKTINDLIKDDTHLTATECLRLGFIHAII